MFELDEEEFLGERTVEEDCEEEAEFELGDLIKEAGGFSKRPSGTNLFFEAVWEEVGIILRSLWMTAWEEDTWFVLDCVWELSFCVCCWSTELFNSGMLTEFNLSIEPKQKRKEEMWNRKKRQTVLYLTDGVRNIHYGKPIIIRK